MLHGNAVACGDDSSLSAEDKAAGWILTCTYTPASDMVSLDIDDVSALAAYPSKTVPCRIDALDRLAPDVVRVMLRFPPTGGPRYLAGQYVDVVAKSGVRRSYSLANHSDPTGRVELQIKRVDGGVLSNYWFGDAKAGDLLRIEGPKGTFFLRDVTGRDLVFLATGTGIAPVKAMLSDLQQRPAAEMPRSVSLYWGGRQPADLYWQPPENAALRYVPVVSRGGSDWHGARGHVQEMLLADMPDLGNAVVYACGSSAMIDSASTQLVHAGLKARSFFSDAFVSSSI